MKTPKTREMDKKRRVRKRALISVIASATGQDSCAVCGDTAFLEWDHIDRSTKSYTVGGMPGKDCPMSKIWTEIKKCQRLCKSCHHDKGEHGRMAIDYSDHKCNRCGDSNWYKRARKDSKRGYGYDCDTCRTRL